MKISNIPEPLIESFRKVFRNWPGIVCTSVTLNAYFLESDHHWVNNFPSSSRWCRNSCRCLEADDKLLIRFDWKNSQMPHGWICSSRSNSNIDPVLFDNVCPMACLVDHVYPHASSASVQWSGSHVVWSSISKYQWKYSIISLMWKENFQHCNLANMHPRTPYSGLNRLVHITF